MHNLGQCISFLPPQFPEVSLERRATTLPSPRLCEHRRRWSAESGVGGTRGPAPRRAPPRPDQILAGPCAAASPPTPVVPIATCPLVLAAISGPHGSHHAASSVVTRPAVQQVPGHAPGCPRSRWLHRAVSTPLGLRMKRTGEETPHHFRNSRHQAPGLAGRCPPAVPALAPAAEGSRPLPSEVTLGVQASG